MCMDNIAELRPRFAELYKDFTSRQARFQGGDQNNIREACAKVRTWAMSPEIVDLNIVDFLIWRHGNGIADVGQGSLAGHGCAESLRNAFFSITATMFAAAARTNRISKAQYEQWQSVFFANAGFRSRIVFNRLVFACFPLQFCSVIDNERLQKVCRFLLEQGCLPSGLGLDDMDWFDLCEVIVPVVRAAFPNKDYADHSTFLAAIGVVLN